MQNSRDRLHLLVNTLHYLTRHFREHAILKGGMEMALFSSSRSTNDLDFVFVPFKSKKDIVAEIKKCLEGMGKDINVEVNLSSKNAKFYLTKNNVQIEIEASVSEDLPSVPINTAVLAKPLNLPPQMIRVMKPEIALAHKIAAWNERRLIRDLYDIYFWFSVQKIHPDLDVLSMRLAAVESRMPQFRKRKSMTLTELCDELKSFCDELRQNEVEQELSSLPKNEREGLVELLKGQMNMLIYELKQLRK